VFGATVPVYYDIVLDGVWSGEKVRVEELCGLIKMRLDRSDYGSPYIKLLVRAAIGLELFERYRRSSRSVRLEHSTKKERKKTPNR
jgi:hypothetical protein